MTLFLFSVMVNSYLLFALKSSDSFSWRPRYTLLKNLIVSDLLLSLALSSTVLRCLLTRHTLVFGGWCILQVTVCSTGILCSLLTLTLMAVERFIFICHGLRYMVILTSKRLHVAIALTWVLSVTVAVVRVGLLLSGQTSFGRAIPGLLCDPVIMDKLPGLHWAIKMFHTVTIIVVLLVCILTFSICYRRMYQAARRAVEPFHSDNSLARHTITFYSFMFFLQLLPIMGNMARLVLRKTMSMTPPYHLSLAERSMFLTVLVAFMVPPCINPLAYGIRNMEVRHTLAQLFRLQQRRREEVA
ncbi:olfactory receptor 14I1-like [Salvelinus fontinalis]|uniref:olfactory receptor 14I1-like n=1 Tax=Salvelinus fontinalis TaxID=8038 RepID=UPI002486BC38|nr:olfactory receptor 14I1-like [Salvelinus fontinalis]